MAKQGYHVSPVAYKRQGTRVKGATLRRYNGTRIRREPVTVEVCRECGSDRIERSGPSVHCYACRSGYMTASDADKSLRKVDTREVTESVIRFCYRCDDRIEPGDYCYTLKAYATDSDELVSLHYCERHAPYANTSSRAFRKEKSAERRQRPAHRTQAYSKRLARKPPRRLAERNVSHHDTVRHARRSGWAVVDGVWKKVV